jgi:hypothetical protein
MTRIKIQTAILTATVFIAGMAFGCYLTAAYLAGVYTK